jgi:hypothetical protein
VFQEILDKLKQPGNFLRILTIILLMIVAVRKFETDLYISGICAFAALLVAANVIRNLSS